MKLVRGASIETMEGGDGLAPSSVISLRVNDVGRTDDLPGQMLLESKSFYMMVKVGGSGPTFVIRKVLECSFCSLNVHLHEDCQVHINLSSAQVGVTKVVGWNTPAADVVSMAEDGKVKGSSELNKEKGKKSDLKKQRDRERQRARRAAKMAEKVAKPSKPKKSAAPAK
jgi:hypothetical protein